VRSTPAWQLPAFIPEIGFAYSALVIAGGLRGNTTTYDGARGRSWGYLCATSFGPAPRSIRLGG
jgi:hypothetical protein